MDRADRLGVRPVDDPARVHAQGADPVAGPEERQVPLHDLVQQSVIFASTRRWTGTSPPGSLELYGLPPTKHLEVVQTSGGSDASSIRS